MKTFTIAIPTYKRQDLLRDALFSAINQEGGFIYTILIVDDDPTSETSKDISSLIASSPSRLSIKYHRNTENLGIYRNWNRCIELAETEFLTILNDDDFLSSNFLIEVLPLLEEYQLVAVDANYIDAPSNEYGRALSWVRRIWRRGVLYLAKLRPIQNVYVGDFLKGHPFVASLGVAFSTRIARQIGGFDPSLYPSSDYEFFFRYWENASCAKLRRRLATYRYGFNVSLKVETLTGWLEKDRDIKRSFVLRRVKSRFVNLLFRVIDIQANIDAYRYLLVNASFDFTKALTELRIPVIPIAQSRLFQNSFTFISRFFVPKFVLKKH